MAQYVGSYKIEDLIADLKLCNNGYLFAPSGLQLRVAQENPFVFTVHNGTVYLQSKFSEQLKGRQVAVPQKPKKAVQWSDGPDYEAWILNRQEALVFGD